MIDETSDTAIKNTLGNLFLEKSKEKYKRDKDLKGKKLYNFEIGEKDFQTIIIQARALQLIKKLVKKGDNDDDRLWKLTLHGDEVMTELRAIKR